MLYPLKFYPRLKERIWGGNRLAEAGKKPYRTSVRPDRTGESWEISGVEGDASVVRYGPLRNNNLRELTEVFMGDLVGDSVYEKYETEFPLLVKLIDARDVLSVQVHPDDGLAARVHGCRGKTEMWYIVDSEPGAHLWIGFDRETSEEEYLEAVRDGTLTALLRRYDARPGDAFLIPAGTVHALGKGILLAEIQETSDVTYRIDDWGRTDSDGRPRELHTGLAAEAIRFGRPEDLRLVPRPDGEGVSSLVRCEHFNVNLLKINGRLERDYAPVDSFVAYLCIEGSARISYSGGATELGALESLLVPADETDITFEGEAAVLETYVDIYPGRGTSNKGPSC